MADWTLPLDTWSASWIEPVDRDDVRERQRTAHHLGTFGSRGAFAAAERGAGIIYSPPGERPA